MLDYYNITEEFSEEEKLVAATTKSFTDNEVLPIIEKYYSDGKFPMDLIKTLGELGLLAVTLPTKYGGSELNYVSYGIAMQELERGDSGIRSFASVQNSLVIYPIFTYGTDEQKNKFLPKLASGEFVGCFGLTEPDFGSNPGGMLTTATKTPKGYILNGAKMWITNGSIADIAVVWAKLDGKVNGFIVEKGTPGFTTIEMKGKHSLKASVTSELIFNDCLVPLNNRLEIEGLRGPLSCLNQARYGISWGAIGSAIASYETALNYAKTRIQFGKPIASFQIIQEKLVWMLNEITKAQLVSYHLGRLKDKKLDRPQQTSLAKRNNVDIALQCARLAREILGANGILNEYPVMRHMANLESVKTYEGTHDIHTLILGADITGIEAFS
ncbi:MAG: acyl-CoA dehydrogenase family protein [Candidatus Kapabacteria bacterium]|nr:acyl-CoA dehydrogenase family protein [Candidatus Kapabacteria bacterium]